MEFSEFGPTHMG